MTAPRERRSEQPETTDAAAAQADPTGQRRAFLRDLEVRGASAATRRSYASDLQQLLEWLAERDLTVSDLGRRQVRAFSAELGRRGYAPATSARKLSTLRGFARHLTESGVLAADPARSLPGPRRRRRLPRVLSVSDVDTLVAATEGTDPLALRDRAHPRAALRVRPAQHGARGLRLGDVQAAQAQLIVHGKGGKTRIVPLGRRGRRGAAPVPGTRPRRARAAARGAGSRCPEAPPGSAAPALAERPRPAHVGRTPARSKIQPACGYRSCVAAHVAARVCDAHAGEGCRSSCHPGAARARLRLDDAGVHARQRRASAAYVRSSPPAGLRAR